MPYITPDEYTSLTGQQAPSNFTLLEKQAKLIIDRETLYRLQDNPQGVSDDIKNAMALEIQYLDQHGGLFEAAQSNASVSLGKYNYTAGSKQTDVAPGVIESLFSTGILYRGL